MEGGGRGRCRAGAVESGRLGRCSSSHCTDSKVRSLLGPLSGASHSRVPCLRIPRKGRVADSATEAAMETVPKAAPSPKATAPVLPLTGLPGTQPLSPGPHHLWLAEQPLNPKEPTDAALERGST